MDSRHDFESVLAKLVAAPKITRLSAFKTIVPSEPGVYVLWFAGSSPTCLKVGIAGPRQGQGLSARLKNHYRSHVANSVLARHLEADNRSPWCAGKDFTQRDQRRSFLDSGCYFQALAVPLNNKDLRQLESKLIERLRPTYIGRVRKADT
jgi:hypothetical protein